MCSDTRRIVLLQRMASNGTCVNVECKDVHYDQEDLECIDNRPKQLVAFLLSIFLSSCGAANFYIGRDDLGTMHGIMYEGVQFIVYAGS